jgi:hypothetical protein
LPVVPVLTHVAPLTHERLDEESHGWPTAAKATQVPQLASFATLQKPLLHWKPSWQAAPSSSVPA